MMNYRDVLYGIPGILMFWVLVYWFDGLFAPDPVLANFERGLFIAAVFFWLLNKITGEGGM